MRRRATLNEMLWPDAPEDRALAEQWARDIAHEALDLVWRGYDALCPKLGSVNFAEPPEQLERNLTSLHFGEIQRLWKADTDGFVSFLPTHESPEFETRSSASAKPPAYDLGFGHHANARWQWPIEAKVVITSTSLAEYLKDVRDKYVAGIAAPRVGEAGMIAYLLGGQPDELFAKLAKELDQTLSQAKEFSQRPHRCSSHARHQAPHLSLHHMVMLCLHSLN